MDTLYGMRLPLGAHPHLPLGGQDVVDYAQYGGPTPEAYAAEQERNQQTQAAQAAQVQAAQQQAQTATRQQAAGSQFIDWPTYLSNHTTDDPATVYDDYLNVAAPSMWAAMGATPEQVAQTQASFAQKVPRPASVPPQPEAGYLGNAYGTLTQAGRGMLRAQQAAAATAAGDPKRLAELALEQVGEEAKTPKPLKDWEKAGGMMWSALPQTFKNAVKNPEGAFDSALATIAGFGTFVGGAMAGSVAGSVVPGVGTAIGGIAGMAGAAGTETLGAVALSHIINGMVQDRKNIHDAGAIEQWIADNGTKVFGDAWKSAGTVAAITALTGGVARFMQAPITAGLSTAARAAVAEQAGFQTTTTAAALRAAQRGPLAKKIGVEVGGYTGAGVAGAYAAGDTPEANNVISQTLGMLLPSLVHARGQLAARAPREVGALKQAVPEKPPSTVEEIEPTEEAFTGKPAAPPAEPPAPPAPPAPSVRAPREPEPFSEEELTAAYERHTQTRLDDEATVREAMGLPAKTKAGTLKKSVLADEARAVADAQTTADKINALETLAAAADKRGKTDVVERAQAKADELRTLEPATEDEVVDNAAAVHLARDIVQEAVDEQTQANAQVLQREVGERAAARPAAAAEEPAPTALAPAAAPAEFPAAGRGPLAPERPAGPAADVAVQPGVGEKGKKRPGLKRGAGVDQEKLRQAAAPVPERGEPAGAAGAGGPPAAAGPGGTVGPLERQKPHEPADVATAKTGQPFSAKLMRGTGRKSTPYNPLVPQKGVLGEGRYTTTDREFAKYFGPEVTEHQVELKNPLVISSDTQWRALTKRAGWPFPNPISITGDVAKAGENIARLRAMVEADGHDGIVVRIPKTEAEGKTMQKVFGADQVLEFKVPEKPRPDLTLAAATDKTLLEQQALIKELAKEGIPAKLAYGRSGVLEFKTAEDKAKAQQYLADKQAEIERVKAALTARAGDPTQGPLPPTEAAVSAARKTNRKADLLYMEREMGYDPAEAKRLYDQAVEDGTLSDLQKEIDDHKSGTVEQPGLREKVPLEKGEVEAAVKAADEMQATPGRVPAGAKLRRTEHKQTDVLSVPNRRLRGDFILALNNGRVDSKIALEYLARVGDSPLTRALARQLADVLGMARIPVNIRDLGNSLGEYVHLQNEDGTQFLGHHEINLHHDGNGLTEHTLLHELTHAATVQAFVYPKTEMQRVAGRRMQHMFRQALREPELGVTRFDPATNRGFHDELEFIAEAFSNPLFQAALSRVKYDDPFYKSGLKVPTLWQAFKDTVARLLTGTDKPSEHMSLLQAAISHSADLFDTGPVIRLEEGQGWVVNKHAIKASEAKEKQAEDAFAKTPHDAILGLDENGDRTHIAYRNEDGSYNMYETTPENQRGDPDTKRVNLSREQVHQAMGEAGGQPMERAGADFRAEPRNNRTQLNGWKNGTRQFAAFKQADGSWNVYKGDDLSDRSQRGIPEKFKDLDAVMEDYKKGGYLKTEAQDAARTRDEQPRDIVQYGGPSAANISLWDRANPIKYLAAQAEQQLGRLPEFMRPDIPALLKNSWINRDIRRMERDEMNPLVDAGRKLLKDHTVKPAQFDKDITMLVSKERSESKLGREDYNDLPDLKRKLQQNADDANRHLNALDPTYRRAMEAYGRQLKTFGDRTVDIAAELGLMPRDRATAIKSAYEFYVPLQTGKRTSVGKRATGASAVSDSPVQRLIEQRRSTIMRGYDNMEKRAIYELASAYNIQHKDGSKMFSIAPLLEYGFDKDGLVTTVLDTMVMNNEAVAVMIDGKPYRIAVHDKDFLDAIKNIPGPEAQTIKGALHGMAVFNAIYGGLKTAASPVFAVKNFIRDATTALVQNDPRISTGRLALSLVEPKVWLAAIHDAFEIGRDTPGGVRGPIADFAAKVRDAGGLIDRRAAYGLDAVVDDVRADIDPNWLRRLPANTAKQFSIEHGAITKPLTVWTKTLENATRMAVFDAAKKSGLSDADAAIAAKTTTVNFEPKGNLAGLINPLYVFANAKLQGTRTYAEKLGLTGIRGGNFAQRLQRGNRRTQIATGLGLFIGMLAAKYGYDTSEKDKDGRSTYGKLSDYQKDDYLTGKSGGFSLPLPPELAWSYILGQSLVDGQMNDRWADSSIRQQKAATRFGTAMVQTFVPGGTSMSDPVSDQQGQTVDYWRRLITPTPLAMPIDIAMNKTTFGSPIVTGQRPNVPQYATGAANYPNYAALTKTLHDTTGLNVAPQVLKYLTDQWLKPQIDVYNAVMGTTPTNAIGQPQRGVFERTFFQTASPFTDKNDLEELRAHTVANTYDPLHKGKVPQLKLFEDADKQEKKIMKGWDKMTPEQKQRASERMVDVRANTLKQYQRAIQQAEGQP